MALTPLTSPCHISVIAGQTEMCFWPANNRKKLDFFEVHTSLGPGALKLLRHIWRKLDTASLHFRCVSENSCMVSWKEFFPSVFQVLDWSFLVLHFYGNVCNWIPEVIWPRLGYFWSFMLEYASFNRLHTCMDWNLHELLKCYFFLTTSSLLDSLTGFLVCSSIVLVTFSQ